MCIIYWRRTDAFPSENTCRNPHHKDTVVTDTLFPSLSQSGFTQYVTGEFNIVSHAPLHTTYTNKELKYFTHIHTRPQTHAQGSPGLQCLAGVQCWSGSALENGRPCLQPINQALPATPPLSSPPPSPAPNALFHPLPAVIPLHFADKSTILYTISHAPPHLC